jgi:hypothetical protein
MKAAFFATSATTPKCNGVEDSFCGILCHESKVTSLHASSHCIEQCSIITWLERNLSTPFTREIRAEDKQFAMVELA